MEGLVCNLIVVMMMLASMAAALPLSAQSPMSDLTFRPCEGVTSKGKLIYAKFNGTSKGPIAVLHKGSQVAIDFHFESDVDEATLTSKVAGKIGVLPYVNFPLSNPDACKDSGLVCPVKNHVEVDYKPIMDVKSFYPSVNVVVKWELKDGAGNDVFCATFLATLTS